MTTKGYDADFFDAVEFGDLDSARMYSNAGKSVDLDFIEPRGKSVLMIACFYGHTHIVGWLLERGADPDIKDHQGKTALDYAIDNEKPDCVALLKRPE